jgi:hypothetical protein
VILAGSVIAAAAVAAAVACRRRGCCDSALAGSGDDAEAGFPAQSTAGAGSGPEGVPETGAHDSHEIAAFEPA